VGLGRESRFPPGSRLGPVIVSRPSASDGRALISAEQNPLWRSCANPSVHSFSSLPLPCRSERATELVVRRATQREERKRARGAVLSPSLVCAPTVGWTCHRRVALVASLHVRAHRRGGERRLRRDFNAVCSSTRGAPTRSWVRPHAD
jgi:hypothetical protein